MSRGNRRDVDRERAQKRAEKNGTKGKKNADGTNFVVTQMK
jgi:hypothetical protein